MRASLSEPWRSQVVPGKRQVVNCSGHHGESESGHMMLEKVRWIYFDAYLWKSGGKSNFAIRCAISGQDSRQIGPRTFFGGKLGLRICLAANCALENFSGIGYILPTIWGIYVNLRMSVRSSSAGLRDLHFLKIYIFQNIHILKNAHGHWHLPIDKHPPIVGIIYPIPVYKVNWHIYGLAVYIQYNYMKYRGQICWGPKNSQWQIGPQKWGPNLPAYKRLSDKTKTNGFLMLPVEKKLCLYFSFCNSIFSSFVVEVFNLPSCDIWKNLFRSRKLFLLANLTWVDFCIWIWRIW